MISVLNRLYPDRLGVIAHTSVQRYKGTGATIQQVGNDLKVDHVVQGSVQRDGGQAHITARLIRVKDGATVWNASYNRDLNQTVAMQAEIAQAIQEGLEARKQGDEDTATAKLGRAVALAQQSGNEDTANLLAKVVDVVDAATGAVRLKQKVEDADEMALDTRSTKTVRTRK